MEYNIGKSNNNNIELCVQEATAKFRKPKLILFFSPVKHFDEYASLIHQKFPDSISMGATVIASFAQNGAEKNALMAIGIENGIRCSADVLENIDTEVDNLNTKSSMKSTALSEMDDILCQFSTILHEEK